MRLPNLTRNTLRVTTLLLGLLSPTVNKNSSTSTNIYLIHFFIISQSLPPANCALLVPPPPTSPPTSLLLLQRCSLQNTSPPAEMRSMNLATQQTRRHSSCSILLARHSS